MATTIYLLLFVRFSLNKIGYLPILLGEGLILFAYYSDLHTPIAALSLAIIWPIIWLWAVVSQFVSSTPESELEEYLTVVFQTTRIGRLILNFCEYKKNFCSK